MKKPMYDYVEYYVGMAKMVAYWHVNSMGFDLVGYSGEHAGVPNEISYFLKKNDVNIIITSAATPNNYPVISFVDKHGNGVKRLGIKVENLENTLEKIRTKAIVLGDPYTVENQYGKVKRVDVKLFDDNIVTFSDYSDYKGKLFPGFQPCEVKWGAFSFDSGIRKIDHIACALRENESIMWEAYVNNLFHTDTVFEFKKEHAETNRLGMQLKVLSNDDKSVSNVLVEPDGKFNNSQVQTFIDGYYGNGIQHIAFETDDIFMSMKMLKARGTEFVNFPDEYYDALKKKYPLVDCSKLQEAGILCEKKEDSFLLQTFTVPIGDRPTFFYEIIQRVNRYDGFGMDNIRNLFDAVQHKLQKIVID